MKKILKFSVILCILFYLYSMLNFYLEMKMKSINWDIVIISELFFLVLYLIIYIKINNNDLYYIFINTKKTLMLSLCCSIGSSLCFYITTMILSLIYYGTYGVSESIWWFNLFLLLGFITLFIIYFIVFICYIKIKKRRD